ncbi:MAG: retroviral-like aspartic protease family protein [Planctomycetaceae bacterium]|jgi:hypothetical protein|nr:retroviral-like aspartic protease family protein [Planctomycetaceae bacterium]
MFSKPVIYPFSEERPIVWILLENPQSAGIHPLRLKALVDSGASRTLIPYTYCTRLGYDFEKGQYAGNASGVGGGVVRTFSHTTRITLLDAQNTADIVAFPSFELQASYIEQNLPFILFGQRDFLKRFRYTQHGQNEWFSLEPIQ